MFVSIVYDLSRHLRKKTLKIAMKNSYGSISPLLR